MDRRWLCITLSMFVALVACGHHNFGDGPLPFASSGGPVLFRYVP